MEATKSTGIAGAVKPVPSDADQAGGCRVTAPAGWFMKDWNLEAPADAAAPDIAKVEVGLSEREEGERAGASRTSRTTIADDEWGDLC